MVVGLIHTQPLERRGVGQHRASLFGQGGEATCDRLLLRHAHRKHLPGFLPGGGAAQGRQTKRKAIGILDFAHPVLLGHPEKRFDLIRTDWQANFPQPQRRGRLKLELKIGGKLKAHSSGGDRFDQRRALCQCVVTEPLGFENRLALKQGHGIVAKPFDQHFARG